MAPRASRHSWLAMIGLAFLVTGATGAGFTGSLSAQVFTYSYFLNDTVLHYDLQTGDLDFQFPVDVVELSTSPGFPNTCDGFSMGVAHDPAVLDLLQVLQGEAVVNVNAGLGPDFWAPTVLTNGFTIGVVFSFMTPAGIEFDTTQTVIEPHYRSVPGVLAGNHLGTTTTLNWDETLTRSPTGPPVANILTVDGLTRHPQLFNAVLELLPDQVLFRRGDCNSDGAINISDAIALLSYLFPLTLPGPELDCRDSCDGNDDGTHNITDAIAILGALFGSPPNPLPPPYPACGEDATPADPLDCSTGPACP